MSKNAKKPTGQANFKFPPEFMRNLRKFCEEHPLKPSMTRVVMRGTSEYMDKERARLQREE